MAERTVTPQQLAVALHQIANQGIPELGVEVQRRATVDLFVDVAGTWPKGSSKTSIHPGKSAASLRASIDAPVHANLPDAPSYPRLGAVDAVQALQGLTLGKTTYVTDDARTDGSEISYAPFLDAGSSPQAPQGVFPPAIARLAGRAGEIVEKAIGAVLRKLGMA